MANRREAILDMWAAGRTCTEIAAFTGLSRGGINMTVYRARDAGDVRAVRRYTRGGLQRDAAIVSRILDRWAAGDTSPEIGAEFGTSASNVRHIVLRARKGGDPRASARYGLADFTVGVPPWVPEGLHRAYVVRARSRGEHAAARWARQQKAAA